MFNFCNVELFLVSNVLFHLIKTASKSFGCHYAIWKISKIYMWYNLIKYYWLKCKFDPTIVPTNCLKEFWMYWRFQLSFYVSILRMRKRLMSISLSNLKLLDLSYSCAEMYFIYYITVHLKKYLNRYLSKVLLK